MKRKNTANEIKTIITAIQLTLACSGLNITNGSLSELRKRCLVWSLNYAKRINKIGKEGVVNS